MLKLIDVVEIGACLLYGYLSLIELFNEQASDSIRSLLNRMISRSSTIICNFAGGIETACERVRI